MSANLLQIREDSPQSRAISIFFMSPLAPSPLSMASERKTLYRVKSNFEPGRNRQPRKRERDHDQVDLIWPPPSSLQRIIKWF